MLFSVAGGKNPHIEDPQNQLEIWASSDWAERAFCKQCGSSLYYKLKIPGPMNGEHYFCAGGIEDWKDMKFGTQVYVDRKPDVICFQTDPDHVTYTKAEIEARYAAGGDGHSEEEVADQREKQQAPVPCK